MSDWSTQRVEQLAADAAALKAAQGVAKPARWVTLGKDEQLLWGECQGSGQLPYQVRVDLTDAANKCSCPSRKLPCKHALGLLLMLAKGTAIPRASPPPFVAEWQAGRAQRAASRTAREAAPPDPEKQARTAARREARIEEGLELLDSWMSDLIGQGLASARAQPDAYWTAVAARLVDCQAAGLARRVRQLGETAVSTDWQGPLLVGLGRLRLLIDAHRRLSHLPPALAAEVRTQVAGSQQQGVALAREGVRGHWQVLAHRLGQEDKLRVQHTWLACGAQVALLIDYAAGGKALPASYAVGQRLDAEVAYFDGATPLRALIKQLHAQPQPAGTLTLPGAQDVAAVQARYGQLLAANPWLERWPLVLGPVTPDMQEGRCQLIDAAGRRLPTPERFAHGWHLVAVSQGSPCRIFGEWDGSCFEPLSVEQQGHLYNLMRLEEVPVLSRVA